MRKIIDAAIVWGAILFALAVIVWQAAPAGATDFDRSEVLDHDEYAITSGATVELTLDVEKVKTTFVLLFVEGSDDVRAVPSAYATTENLNTTAGPVYTQDKSPWVLLPGQFPMDAISTGASGNTVYVEPFGLK